MQPDEDARRAQQKNYPDREPAFLSLARGRASQRTIRPASGHVSGRGTRLQIRHIPMVASEVPGRTSGQSKGRWRKAG